MFIFQMSVKLTPTVSTLEKSVKTAVVNARMVGSYMTESASQVCFTHFFTITTTVNYRMVGSYMTAVVNARIVGSYMTESAPGRFYPMQGPLLLRPL